MNSATLPTTSVPEVANGFAPDAPAYWAATIDAAPEPALLARVLQRLMVQGATIDRLRYEADEARASVCIEVLFRADEEHARLLARRLETIVSVDRVSLCPARVSREASRTSRPRAA